MTSVPTSTWSYCDDIVMYRRAPVSSLLWVGVTKNPPGMGSSQKCFRRSHSSRWLLPEMGGSQNRMGRSSGGVKIFKFQVTPPRNGEECWGESKFQIYEDSSPEWGGVLWGFSAPQAKKIEILWHSEREILPRRRKFSGFKQVKHPKRIWKIRFSSNAWRFFIGDFTL